MPKKSEREQLIAAYVERRKAAGLDASPEHVATVTFCTVEEGRCVQSPGIETDLNVLLRRQGSLNAIPVVGGAEPFFGDVSEVKDFHSALQLIQETEAAFMAQPAHLRAQFENDPQKFAEFLSDPANKAELVRLGLVKDDVAPVKPEEKPPVAA